MKDIGLSPWPITGAIMLAAIIASCLLQASKLFMAPGQRSSETNVRMLEFAGQQWIVKSGCGLGPGNNCWSDSEQSVWLESGELHLKIRKIDGVWHSAEVYSTACTRYGVHRFYIVGRPDELDKNIVVGLFLYKDDSTEIDIEFAKWGEQNPTQNAQYVVQPWSHVGNREQFSMTLNDTLSTHYIDWAASEIRFGSFHGHGQEPPDDAHVIHEWQYMGDDIPSEGECLKIHINFWLHQSNPPSDEGEAELIVMDADFPDAGQQVRYSLLPLVLNYPNPTATPAAEPRITVAASDDQAWGEVGPSSYCNANFKVALYAKTDIWYVQPVTAEPGRNIAVNPDCTWKSRTNPWVQVAAHLVPTNYVHPSTVNRVSSCPPPPLESNANPNVLAAACYP